MPTDDVDETARRVLRGLAKADIGDFVAGMVQVHRHLPAATLADLWDHYVGHPTMPATHDIETGRPLRRTG